MLGRQFLLPLDDGRRLAQLGHLLQRLDEIRPVHHGDARHVVAHARRVGVLADVGALADLLDDVLFLAELRAWNTSIFRPPLVRSSTRLAHLMKPSW